MMPFVDVHTHKFGGNINNNAITIKSINLGEDIPNSIFSIGLHPWYTTNGYTNKNFRAIEKIAISPKCLAIGEVGLDYIYNTNNKDIQRNIFIEQIKISEKLAKPLIIHLVKATNDLLNIKEELKPKQPWIIHGFRGKPTLAKVFLDRDIYLSMGEKINKEALNLAYNRGLLLLETDDSNHKIDDIYKNVSEILNIELQDLKDILYKSYSKIFYKSISI